MKTFLKIIATIWLVFTILYALLWFTQIFKDLNFKKEKLIPSVEYIKSFKSQTGKIPNLEEFNSQEINENVSYEITDKIQEEFRISVWRGEWYESYNSKTEEFENGNPPFAMILYVCLLLFIGGLPFLLIKYYNK